MTPPLHLPRGLVLIGAATAGALLSLAMHMLTRSNGFDLATLWRADLINPPTTAALAWWLMALAGFIGGLVAAALLKAAMTGYLPPGIRRLTIILGISILIAAGQTASAPASPSASAGVIGGIAALCVGAVLALFGASVALRSK